MKWANIFILVSATLLENAVSDDDWYCRNKPELNPHMNGLWNEGFPENNELNFALCEGTISISDDGELCIDGRVNYEQMTKFVKENYSESHNIYQPAAPTISVTGHLISGTGNAVFGPSAKFLYDFVTSYVVNGTTYSSNSTMIDSLLAASRGVIDGVCFNSSFVQEESYYDIHHEGWMPDSVDIDKFAEGNIFFGSKTWVTAEYHTSVDSEPPMFSKIIGSSRFKLFQLTVSFPTPSFVFNIVPIFQFTSLLRTFIVGSVTLATSVAPQPLFAPDAYVENAQLDISWSNFLLLVENGIYATIPDKMGTITKKITPDVNSNGCWQEPVASIDFQIPVGFDQVLDDYVSGEFYTKLLEVDSDAELTFHFGKRVPEDTSILQAALDKFESCGATLNITPEKCHHPLCTRTVIPSEFEYPEEYFDLLVTTAGFFN